MRDPATDTPDALDAEVRAEMAAEVDEGEEVLDGGELDEDERRGAGELDRGPRAADAGPRRRPTALDLLTRGRAHDRRAGCGRRPTTRCCASPRCPAPATGPASRPRASTSRCMGERPLGDFPDATLGAARGRGVRGLAGDRLGDRAADGPPRRAVRRGDGPALDPGRPGGRPRRAGRRREPVPPADRRVRRRRQQHRPQGRPPHPGPGRPRVRRRPRRDVLAGAQAADGALGLAGPAVQRRRRSPCCATCAPGPRRGPRRRAARPAGPDRGGGDVPAGRPAAGGGPVPQPDPRRPALPWPPGREQVAATAARPEVEAAARAEQVQHVRVDRRTSPRRSARRARTTRGPSRAAGRPCVSSRSARR